MIPAEAIDAYADTTIAYDKAGGYGIQEYGGSTFVERISGCYYNVMGLPINRVARTIIELLES